MSLAPVATIEVSARFRAIEFSSPSVSTAIVSRSTVAELADRYSKGVIVRSPRAAELSSAVERAGGIVMSDRDADVLQVTGIDAASVGVIAARLGIPLLELSARSASLEDAYLALTADATDHAAQSFTGSGHG